MKFLMVNLTKRCAQWWARNDGPVPILAPGLTQFGLLVLSLRLSLGRLAPALGSAPKVRSRFRSYVWNLKLNEQVLQFMY